MRKVYSSSPLPFQGQKRRFLKQFKECLKSCNGSVYIDLFGGSGLLSHTVKTIFPDAHVVYNDFDGFSERIKAIPITNSILNDLRDILKQYPRGKIVINEPRNEIIKLLESVDKNYGFVDYITLSSSLLFSMNYVQSLSEMKKQSFYNCIKMTDYFAEGYLDGVEVVRYDYKELFKKYKDKYGVIFLVDPPYLSTDCSTYGGYWKLKDYLDVLNVLDGTDYFYFTSNKSNIIELCEWIETRPALFNPFTESEEYRFVTNTTHNTGYTDIMRFKYTSDNT